MSSSHYSNYLSKVEASSPASTNYRSMSPSVRMRLSSAKEDDKTSVPYNRHENNNESIEYRDSSNLPSPSRSHNEESRSTPSKRYNRIDRFASDASINTNALNDSIDKVLDRLTSSPIVSPHYPKSNVRSTSEGRDYVPATPPQSMPYANKIQSRYNRERSLSPLADRTMHHDVRSITHHTTRDYSPYHREHRDRDHRDMRIDDRYNTPTYQRERYNSPHPREDARRGREGGSYTTNPSYYDNFDASSHRYSTSNRDSGARDSYDSRRRDNYGAHRNDAYGSRRSDDYHERDRRGNSVQRRLSHRDNYDDGNQYNSRSAARSSSTGRYEYIDNHNGRPQSATGTNKTGNDTLMTFEVVNDGGKIKFKSRNPSPMYSGQTTSTKTLYEFSPEKTIQNNQPREEIEGQQQIVINFQSGSKTPQTYSTKNYAHMALDKVDDDASDLSSVTGIPKSLRVVVAPNKSTMSNKSVGMYWKNNDVVFLPKDDPTLGASIAAAAAASLIVSEGPGSLPFDVAVTSVSNMLAYNEEGKDDTLAVVKPSISYGDIYGLNDDKLVPISFTLVKNNMKSVIRAKWTQSGEGSSSFTRRMNASDFYARCAVLAATAIMKADPVDKAMISLTAAATIMNFYKIIVASDDWIQVADDTLREVSNEVSESIKLMKLNNTNAVSSLASLASIAVLSEGGKSLAMERIRLRVNQSQSIDANEHTEKGQHATTKDEKVHNLEDNEEDIISPIRNKGSLMDIVSEDSNDSDLVQDDKKSFVVPQKNNVQSRSTALVANNNVHHSIPRVNSLSNKTTAHAMEKSGYSKSEVNNFLSTPTGDHVGVGLKTNIHVKADLTSNKQNKPELDKKQEEMAKRVKRIQMRAAGKSDTEINAALGRRMSFSENNVSLHELPKLQKGTTRSNNASPKKNRVPDNESDDMLTAKDIINGIGNMIAPVKSYLEGLNIASSFEQIKQLNLPQCNIDANEDEFEGNEYRQDPQIDVEDIMQRNAKLALNHNERSKFGSTNNNNGNIYPGVVEVEEGWKSSLSSSGDDITERLGYHSSDKSPNKVTRNSGASSPRKSQDTYNSFSLKSDSFGAFSDALRTGGHSNIPIQKLSLTPPSSEKYLYKGNNDVQPTPKTDNLDAVSNSRSSSPVKKSINDDNVSPPSTTMNVPRGPSERNGFITGEAKNIEEDNKPKGRRRFFSRRK